MDPKSTPPPSRRSVLSLVSVPIGMQLAADAQTASARPFRIAIPQKTIDRIVTRELPPLGPPRSILERAGGFSRVELNAIAKLVEEHSEHLLRSWNDFFGR